jgi:hypothetical protein
MIRQAQKPAKSPRKDKAVRVSLPSNQIVKQPKNHHTHNTPQKCQAQKMQGKS